MIVDCKDVCDQATDYLEGESSFLGRFTMRLHLLMCRECRRFMRQFQLMIDASSDQRALEQPSESEIDGLLEKLKQEKLKQPPE